MGKEGIGVMEDREIWGHGGKGGRDEGREVRRDRAVKGG